MDRPKTSENVSPATEHLLRELAPRVLGALVRRSRDFAAAEDAVQEALLAATQIWPVRGQPPNPLAWLIQAATRRLTDRIRRDMARSQRETLMGYPMATPPLETDPHEDDTLILLFLCCHPDLNPAAAIALTLRAVGGLTTAEIASAFLVPEATMAQRITRAKAVIKATGDTFRSPDPVNRTPRLREVMHVLYLIFSEGYAASSGPSLQRIDLAAEAIRLTRLLPALVPNDPEVSGLLALMLLTDARRLARTGPDGELIPLNEQDRTLWDRPQIDEGTALITKALSSGSVGAYQLQAAIAALHDEAASHEVTDWPQILALYEVLRRLAGNPMVSLNHAIAGAMVHGPSAGLQRLDTLAADPRLAGHHRLLAARAHLHEMLSDFAAAATAYSAAARKTTSLPERNYLLRRYAECSEKMDHAR